MLIIDRDVFHHQPVVSIAFFPLFVLCFSLLLLHAAAAAAAAAASSRCVDNGVGNNGRYLIIGSHRLKRRKCDFKLSLITTVKVKDTE